jgi:hypothetical protein
MGQDAAYPLAKVGVAGSNPVVRSRPSSARPLTCGNRSGRRGRGVCPGPLSVPLCLSMGADGAAIRPGLAALAPRAAAVTVTRTTPRRFAGRSSGCRFLVGVAEVYMVGGGAHRRGRPR